jgi:hypothetical protein
LLVPIVALGAARAFEYLRYAWAQLTAPTILIFTEAHTALLAWRAQAGLRLYPDWRDYPHVVNFFGPLYFELVGLLAAAAGADLSQLFVIGRAVSILCVLLTSLLVGVYLGHRHGPWAGASGALLSLGAKPMQGCSVVVRPDMMAELLGIGGILLVVGRSPRRQWAGGALLVLAFFTKQTAGIYLLVAAMALFLAQRRRLAAAVLGGGLAALVLIAALTTMILEPNFASSLLGESKTPWDDAGWYATLGRLVADDPDLLVFTAIGLVVAALGPSREVELTSLAVVILVAGLITTRKLGADVNYYLSLRVVEAMAFALLWRVAKARRAWPLVPLAAVAYAGSWALMSSLARMKAEADVARATADSSRGGPDYSRLPAFREVARLAQDPSVHMLTDVGLFDLYQRERAAIGIPWLFRILVQTGQVDPARMRRWIDDEYYDVIITMVGLESPSYESYAFGLPMTLVERARAHYVLVAKKGGFYYYGRRRDPPGRLRSLLGAELVD